MTTQYAIPEQWRQLIAQVPRLPEAASKLLQCLEQENSSAEDVASCVNADREMMLKLLRLANSPFFGLSGKVESVEEAVLVLGRAAVRSMALAAVLTEQFAASRNSLPWFDWNRFWRRSFATAVCAHQLSRTLHCSAPDVAFTSGLLHDLGVAVFALALPQAYQPVLLQQSDCSLAEREIAAFGFSHGDLSAALLQLWGLPATVIEAVGGNYHDDALPRNALPALVHLANVCAPYLSSMEPGPLSPRLLLCAEQAGLDAAAIATLLETVRPVVDDLCSRFDVV